ncbi:hypothetical protein B7Y92_03100 [Candidatus Saccharibacteria bacterium 32-50-13]|nr:MAG: hypothetical protein B7Y92_03100 [Candidatus Saccharibacteria bacterium 32-50-13]
MAFNHYAKIKSILADRTDRWYIRRINEPTTATNFAGEKRHFDHYYRIYGEDNQAIAYCKFQQIERLARTLKVSVEDLPLVD